jgi:hypothetical protein
MRIAIASKLQVDGAELSDLSVATIHRVLGVPDSVEHIRLYGGGTRFREKWERLAITVLRDEEEKEALCLLLDPVALEITVDGSALPSTEQGFARTFSAAERQHPHAYRMGVGDWSVLLDFSRSKKRRGVGSSQYTLSRLSISLKSRANQRPDGTSAEAPPSNPSQGAAVPHP